LEVSSYLTEFWAGSIQVLNYLFGGNRPTTNGVTKMAETKTKAPKADWSKKKKAPAQYLKRQRERGHVTHQKRSPGYFEAVSKHPVTGKYIRTRHHTRAMAEKRLAGNRWHTQKVIVDYTPKKEDAVPTGD